MKTYDKIWLENWLRAIVYQYAKVPDYEYLTIPEEYTQDGLNVGKWFKEQEELYNNHKLSSLQLSLLSSLRIKWMKTYTEGYRKWFHHCEQLEEYYKDNKTLSMPKDTYMSDGTNLFTWKTQQKQLYKQNKLQQYQIERLEAIGMEWNTKPKGNAPVNKSLRWNDYYKVAKKFYEEHGHLLIKEKDIIDGIPLGKWMQKQKERYLGVRSTPLSKEDIKKLEKIGMSWEPFVEAKWEYIIKLLTEFIKENKGKQKLTKDTIYKGYELGQEFMFIYKRYKNNELSKEKAQKLRMLGFR